MATRLTDAAAIAPAAAVAEPRKRLRAFMCSDSIGSMSRTFGSGRGGNGGRSLLELHRPADDRRLERGIRQPEPALGVEREHHAVHLLARIREQLENADDHSVVAEDVLVGD